MSTRILVAGAGIAALLLGACERRESPDAAAGAATADTHSVGSVSPADTSAAGSADLSDANIVALLDEANQADSAAGAVAARKGTSADVKQFAKLMMSEHHALRAAGEKLAKKLGVTPQPPAEDPVKAMAEAEMAALQSAPKGAEFDRVYIEQEVTAHKAVLDLAEKAHGATENAELKGLIEKAKPVIQKHLEQAESIQKKLGQPAA
jgi:putative membrane protein